MIHMGAGERQFILEAVAARLSAEDFAAVSIPLGPCALKVKEVRVRLEDLTGRIVAGNVVVSARLFVEGIYIDETGLARSLLHREPVSVLIPFAEGRPNMRILPSGRVTDTVAELADPCALRVKAAFRVDVLATECVIMDGFCPATNVTLEKRGFFQAEEEYETGNAFEASLARDASERNTLTYFVRNTGFNAAEVQLEVSPDAVVWQADDILHTLAAQSNIVITPLHFLRFVRVRFRSAVAGLRTRIHIWFQAQA